MARSHSAIPFHKKRFRTLNALRLILPPCAAATLFFYVWQNHFAPHGGAIALPKALWLGLAVFYWLLLPPLVFMNPAIERRLRRAYLLFWLPMLARALIELWLLYGPGGWQYAYGIAHDAFSLILLLGLYADSRHSRPELWRHTLVVMAAMFAAEIYFAHYISAFNHGIHQADLWFIGWEAPHLPNQIFTTLCVLGLGGWLVRMWKAWGRGYYAE